MYVPPPGLYKVAMSTFSRDAAGAQAVSGLGFKPKVVIFFAYSSGAAAPSDSKGFGNGLVRLCQYRDATGAIWGQTTARSIACYNDATNYIRAYISSLDADGFTLTWDLTGTCNAVVIWLALA